MAPMLRIRMGLDDLARVRLATEGVAATIEAVYSSIALRRADCARLFGDWGRQLRPRLSAAVAPLFELIQAPPQVPLFMIKRTDEPGVFAEHLFALPATQIRDELVARAAPDTPIARRLATGDREARRELATAVASYHQAFAGALPAMQSLVHADLAHRIALLTSEGLGGLLNSLHPAMRWRSPVLELDVPVDRELELDGRTLQLTPSVFMRHGLGVLIEPEIMFVTYPARGTLRLADPDPGDPLVDLLGRTRAAALRTLRIACTTTELADHLGVSLASASEHAAVLRRARLVDTHRDGRAVRHYLTRLGHSTLAGDVL
jgi:DNA-binding transcriptional ArsR family regulator